ncbi:nucleoside triphosphate pyrophosphohydrolase [Maritalea sp.]|uniref:nucleoside triphosphate pyrophosphohydrolase n=1 Tax=Maritalea sp. TaxID=2003361 RepID=UPI003EF558EB
MKPSRDIATLIEIMHRLRDPETGCPWDLKQDFNSIKSHTIEEAYEVADAIEREDFSDLKAELGDLLFQPIYYAQMAKEVDKFDFGDVVYGICEKLIRRHPHVFAQQTLDDAEAVNSNWESIKAEERLAKAQDGEPSVLDDVPRALPALTRANKLAKRAARVGFDWPDARQALDKVREELDEVAVELEDDNHERLEEELGDLLFAMSSVARKSNIDPEVALSKANQKFIRRFKYVEKRCLEDDMEIQKAGLTKLEEYWSEIRKADKE